MMRWGEDLTKEELILLEKAIDDVDSIEMKVYHLIKFGADMKLFPDTLKDSADILEKIQGMKRNMKSRLNSAREKR